MSVFRIPFSLSEVIPNASFLRDFTNDHNFFTFSFFLGLVMAINVRVASLASTNVKLVAFSDEASDRTVDPW